MHTILIISLSYIAIGFICYFLFTHKHQNSIKERLLYNNNVLDGNDKFTNKVLSYMIVFYEVLLWGRRLLQLIMQFHIKTKRFNHISEHILNVLYVIPDLTDYTPNNKHSYKILKLTVYNNSLKNESITFNILINQESLFKLNKQGKSVSKSFYETIVLGTIEELNIPTPLRVRVRQFFRYKTYYVIEDLGLSYQISQRDGYQQLEPTINNKINLNKDSLQKLFNA